jgi:hypothetical protein
VIGGWKSDQHVAAPAVIVQSLAAVKDAIAVSPQDLRAIV